MAPSEVPQVCFCTHCKYKFQRLWVNHKGCQWCLVHWKKKLSSRWRSFISVWLSFYQSWHNVCRIEKCSRQGVDPKQLATEELSVQRKSLCCRASGERSALAPVNPVWVQRVSSKALCWQRAGKLIVWSAQWRGDWRKKKEKEKKGDAEKEPVTSLELL